MGREELASPHLQSHNNSLLSMKIRHVRYLWIVLSLMVLFVAVLCTVSRVHYDKFTPASGAMVEEAHYYVLRSASGSDSIYTYIYKGGDTVIAESDNARFMSNITRRRSASWVNWLWLPSCFGTLAAKIDSTEERNSSLPMLEVPQARRLLASRCSLIRNKAVDMQRQLAEIDYYLRTHKVHDEGFDVVARHRETVLHSIDSLTRMAASIERIVRSGRLSVTLTDRYAVVMDGVCMEAMKVSSWRDGFAMYRTTNGTTPKHVRPVYLYSDGLLSSLRPTAALRLSSDTIVVRSDVRGGQTDGYLSVNYPDGSYYEGQYSDTLGGIMRHGFGVDFRSDKVRVGRWEYDRYRGEQPLYTAAHIYGIDISRYQHEPSSQTVRRGRRRRKVTYPILWNQLRITSLGSMSKKRVEGNVDYPISFIYIKSTEGKSLTNRYFRADYAAARKHGYRVGAYHFFSTRTTARQQADNFIKNSRYQKGDLPPALDVEPSAAQISQMGGIRVLLKSVRSWLEDVGHRLGVEPILYVSQSFVNKYLTDDNPDGDYLRKNYQVWIARYGEYKPDVHLAIWQLSPDGRVRGIRGLVDINVFNGFEEAFRDFSSISAHSLPQPSPR